MRTTKKRMHGRKRRRSPVKSWWSGVAEELQKGGKDDQHPAFKAINKNAATAVSEASKKVVNSETGGPTGGPTTKKNQDTTHSHPPAAFEGEEEEGKEETSSRARARNTAQTAMQKLGGSWGNRTFGF